MPLFDIHIEILDKVQPKAYHSFITHGGYLSRQFTIGRLFVRWNDYRVIRIRS